MDYLLLLLQVPVPTGPHGLDVDGLQAILEQPGGPRHVWRQGTSRIGAQHSMTTWPAAMPAFCTS
jgi:hypothetical protein